MPFPFRTAKIILLFVLSKYFVHFCIKQVLFLQSSIHLFWTDAVDDMSAHAQSREVVSLEETGSLDHGNSLFL